MSRTLKVDLKLIVVRVAKVDATIEKNAASTYGVNGYPTLIYFKNG